MRITRTVCVSYATLEPLYLPGQVKDRLLTCRVRIVSSASFSPAALSSPRAIAPWCACADRGASKNCGFQGSAHIRSARISPQTASCHAANIERHELARACSRVSGGLRPIQAHAGSAGTSMLPWMVSKQPQVQAGCETPDRGSRRDSLLVHMGGSVRRRWWRSLAKSAGALRRALGGAPKP